MLSRTARYALRAAVHIAERQEEAPLSVQDLARELDIPRNYLSKTLHRLAQAGVLTSTRGPGGGFRLNRPPEEVALQEVVAGVEPVEAAEARCLLGRVRCSEDDPCAAHGRWCAVREQVEAFFGETTLADLAGDAK